MATRKLTKSLLNGVKPSDRAEFIFDSEIKGFGVKVNPSGRISFILDKRVFGQKKRFTIGAYPEITPEVAKRRAQELLAEIATGKDPKKMAFKGMTLGKVLDEFESFYQSQIGKTIKERTFNSYRDNIKKFTVIRNVLLSEIGYSDIEKLKTQLSKSGLSNRSININLTELKKALNYGLKHGYLGGMPKIDRLSEAKERKIDRLSYEQVKAVLEATDNENIQFYIKVMLYFGLRPHEMLTLKWEHFDWKNKRLTIYSDNRLKSGRTIPISKSAFKYLQVFKELEGRVSPYETTAGARRVMTRIGETLGIKLTPYVLRKTFGSLMAEAGQESFIIGNIMGHKNIKTTYQYYADVEAEKMRATMDSLEI